MAARVPATVQQRHFGMRSAASSYIESPLHDLNTVVVDPRPAAEIDSIAEVDQGDEGNVVSDEGVPGGGGGEDDGSDAVVNVRSTLRFQMRF